MMAAMKCCEKCFRDSELRAIVRRGTRIGRCDICKNVGVHVCYSGDARWELIEENIANLLDSYLPYHDVKRQKCCRELEALPLEEILLRDTEMFALDRMKLHRLIWAMFSNERYLVSSYVSRVDIARERHDALGWILPDGDWNRFEESIKFKSRFCFKNRFNIENFRRAVIRCVKELPRMSIYFRARKWNGGRLYRKKEMGPPPCEQCVSGRLNPSGIRLLYLADTIDTALAEMRPKVKERFCVASFLLKKSVKVLDLIQISAMSPFSNSIDPLFYLSNIRILKKIDEEFRRVVDGANNDLDYLITQYICDVIKECGWQGVLYGSTLHPSGMNLALFDSDNARIAPGSIALYEISQSSYRHERVLCEDQVVV